MEENAPDCKFSTLLKCEFFFFFENLTSRSIKYCEITEFVKWNKCNWMVGGLNKDMLQHIVKLTRNHGLEY